MRTNNDKNSPNVYRDELDIDNIVIRNIFSCSMMDCKKIRYLDSENKCVYEKVGDYYKKIKH